jgi:hypothetical protein
MVRKMANIPGLSKDLQLSLGEKIREHYSAFVQSLPLSLVALSRKISDLPNARDFPTSSAVATFESNSQSGFDPETVAILTEAFEKAWADLAYLETNSVAPAEVSRCLIALLNSGERNASRLASKALLKLIAPRCAVPAGSLSDGHGH